MALPKLFNLNLEYCIKLKNLTPLASMANLRQLNLAYSYAWDFFPLHALVNLEYLSLYKCSELKQVHLEHVGANCKKLEELDISFTQTSSLDFLALLPQLKKLALESTNIHDISCIAHLSLLSELVIAKNFGISTLQPLCSLTRLKKLNAASTRVSDL
ncbi:UNVERIFIED_CONTAM: hypothetical protein HDU68_007067, partial [Siphonaria sp. JEL0065]